MHFRLGFKLIGVTFGLLAFLTVGALGAVHHYIGRQIRQQADRKVEAAAQVLTTVLERTQEQMLGRGRLLAELPSLHAALIERLEQVEPLLQQVKAVRAANLLWATDPEGTVLASTAEYPAVGAGMALHPLVLQTIHGEEAVGFDFFMGQWWLLLSLPVRAEGDSKLLGTVTMALLVGEAYLKRLSELLETQVGFLWQERQFWSEGWPQAARARVATQAEVALGRPPQQIRLDGAGRYLFLVRQIPFGIAPHVGNLTAVVGVPLDEMVLQQIARAIGWITALTMGAGGLLLIGAIRSVTHPLRALALDSRAVASGNLSHRSRIWSRDEVGELALSFNQMLDRLEGSRNELLRAKEYTDRIITSMVDSLVVVDPDLAIRIVNPATAELLGYTKEELIGKTVSTLFVPEHSPFEGEQLQTFLRTGHLRQVECLYRSKSGEKIPVLFTGAVMQDEKGELHGMVAVVQDISERKRLGQLKEEFVSIVSHELRTPLTIIQDGLTLLLEEQMGKLGEDQKRFLKTILRNSDRLKKLVQDLLELSAIRRGEMILKRKAVDLVPLIRESSQAFQEGLEGRRIEEAFQAVPPVYADPERVEQVLRNLISNAVKFTEPREGRIVIHLDREEGFARVSVADNGPGIRQAAIGRLFGEFEQLGRSESERPAGTGLGLAVCRRIVELHGGEISVSSQVGQGSTFTFTLPLSLPGTS